MYAAYSAAVFYCKPACARLADATRPMEILGLLL